MLNQKSQAGRGFRKFFKKRNPSKRKLCSSGMRSRGVMGWLLSFFKAAEHGGDSRQIFIPFELLPKQRNILIGL